MQPKSYSRVQEVVRIIGLIALVCLIIFLLSILGNGNPNFQFWGTATNEIAANAGNSSVRSRANFDWTFIALFAVIIYVYASEIKQKNYKGLVAGLSLYGVHWLYEIANALIQSGTGYALWTVSPESTSFILLVGVSWELSMMFSIAGLIMAKLLPANPSLKILGIHNRWIFAIMNAAFFAIFEIFLAGTPAFIWTYSWWGAIPVFITTYIPFFLAAFLLHDARPRTQIKFLSMVWGCVLLLLVVFIPLGII